MKNIFKFLGIFTILVMIGFVLSCETEADPEDQITITITGLPTNANNTYAIMGLWGPDLKAQGPLPRKIANNAVTNEMVFAAGDNKGKAFGEAGSYKLSLQIYTKASTSDSDSKLLYDSSTTSNLAIKKGANTFTVTQLHLDDDIDDAFKGYEPPETFFGTYTGAGAQTYTETILFGPTQFRISDNSETSNPYLDFYIESWDDASVPGDYSAYNKGYKFTGKIVGASPLSGTNTYINSDKTAPGTSSSDVKADKSGPEFHMYIYTAGSGSSFTFIRTSFVKTGNTDSTTAITQTNGNLRVYTKRQ